MVADDLATHASSGIVRFQLQSLIELSKIDGFVPGCSISIANTLEIL